MKLSTDQRELQGVLRRFLEDKVTSEYRRERIAKEQRTDPLLLTALGELGLEEGFSGDSPMFGSMELGVVSYEAGRVLLPEPVCERMAAMYVVPALLPAEDAEALRAGTGAVCVAPSACCALSNDGARVSGEIEWVSGLEGATRVVGHLRDGRCCIITLGATGVSVEPSASLDLTTALSRVRLDGCVVQVLSEESARLYESGLELVKAQEAAGLCSKVLEMTVEYVRTREQFGVPVGGFQAVQQKIADAYAQSEALRALSQFAAWSFSADPSQRLLTSRAAISYAAAVAARVCEAALQCHGGIGFTWEYDLHLYLRRAKLIESGFPLEGRRGAELLAYSRV